MEWQFKNDFMEGSRNKGQWWMEKQRRIPNSDEKIKVNENRFKY